MYQVDRQSNLHVAEQALGQQAHTDIMPCKTTVLTDYVTQNSIYSPIYMLHNMWLHCAQEQQQQDALTALCVQHTAALAVAAHQANEHIAQIEAEHALHLRQQCDAQAALTEACQQQRQQEADFACEISSLRQLHEQSLRDMQAQHQSQLSQIQAELVAAHHSELAFLASRLAEEHRAELSCQQQLSQQTEVDSAASLSALRAQQQQELSALRAEHSLLVEQLQLEHQQSTSEQTQDFADQLQELQDRLQHEHADELGQAQEGAAVVLHSIQAQQDAHTEQLQLQLQNSQEQLTVVLTEHEQELDAAEAQHQVCCIQRCLFGAELCFANSALRG